MDGWMGPINEVKRKNNGGTGRMLGVAWEVTEEVTEDGYVAPRLPRAWLRCRICVEVSFFVSLFGEAITLRFACVIITVF